MIISVKPIYGYGWTDGCSYVSEPDPFEVDAQRREDGAIYGCIAAGVETDLAGALFEATPRYLNQDSCFNCRIRYRDGRTISGYCEIPLPNQKF
jgi:hypothetical protein